MSCDDGKCIQDDQTDEGVRDMKNCATCKFMNFRCKGKCKECEHKVVDKSFPMKTFPMHEPPFGSFYHNEGLFFEEKCKCIECYDEDSGKYKYWVGEPELVKYFEGVTG